jgi:hypothetical protein
MSIEFYDVKVREKVAIPESKITKIKITQKNGQVRHAFRAMTEDGRKLTKFCSKADWDAMKVPEG